MHIWQSLGTMTGRLRPWIKNSLFGSKSLYGKVTLLATVGGALVLFAVFLTFFDNNVPRVSADVVQTSVNVLNTPPSWTLDAQEDNYDSATSTPTNAGDIVRWRATATDSSADPYWLIICKNNVAPTPAANAAPACNGGAVNQWAVSAGTTTGGGTTSGFQATAATTTKEGYPFNAEKNDWYGWICDGNVSLPQCNALVKTGVSTTGPSPFFIDHPPAFTNLTQTAPQNPGGKAIWTATASSTDIIRGGDSVVLYICSTSVFNYSSTTASCGGTLIAKSATTTINPVASTTITIPTKDATYPAFAFITNNFNLAATTTPYQASSTPYIVNNVAPTISNVTIIDRTGSTTPSLSLVTPNGSSTGYGITLTVNDNNSCQNAVSGNEISSLTANAYRTNFATIGSSTCKLTGDYNTNNCYPSVNTQTNFVCSQDVGSCTVGSVSSTWTCTFPLWYNADPTDTGSVFAGQKWAASVVATDDNGTTSPLTESSSAGQFSKVLNSFTAITVVQSSIAYGGLQPGQQIDPFVAATSTTLKAIGNTGVDESLYGETMCPGWFLNANQNYCDANNNFDVSKDIFASNQKFATSAISYAAGVALTGSSSPTLFGLHVPKTTVTTTPQQKDTLWAIRIPGTITVAGAYGGQNTIIAVTSSSTNW